MSELNVVHKQIIWDRLIGIVEEQAQTIINTAFGTAAREAGDVSAAVFSLRGEMIAQAITGTPGHVNSVANSIKYFLEEFPVPEMRAGDIYITNDPWKATGHLFDITIVTPVFDQGRALCLVASNTHVVDIGGMGVGPDATQIYHEGLFIPVLKFADGGQLSRAVVRFIESNVRQPQQVMGDIHALVSCNEVAAEGLRQLRREYGLADFADIADYVLDTSRQRMIAAIRELPRGSWAYEMTIDGFDHPLLLKLTLSVDGERVHLDFNGTSPTITKALNVPLSYTEAYASFGVRCLVGPHIPNNTGSLSVITLSAPEGCILNAPHPCAVTSRAVIGMMLPDMVFGCLRQAGLAGVPAEGADTLWNIRLVGGQISPNEPRPPEEIKLGRPFTQVTFTTGGMGGRPGQDGLSATAFPSGVRNTSVEVVETLAPLLFWRKALRPDSGGAGQYRGGLGQVVEVESADGADMLIAATFDRVLFPARGAQGGRDGAPGRLSLRSGAVLKGKGRQWVPAGDRLVVETPGGAGYGDSLQRDNAAVRRDVEQGYVSPQQAKTKYGYDI